MFSTFVLQLKWSKNVKMVIFRSCPDEEMVGLPLSGPREATGVRRMGFGFNLRSGKKGINPVTPHLHENKQISVSQARRTQSQRERAQPLPLHGAGGQPDTPRAVPEGRSLSRPRCPTPALGSRASAHQRPERSGAGLQPGHSPSDQSLGHSFVGSHPFYPKSETSDTCTVTPACLRRGTRMGFWVPHKVPTRKESGFGRQPEGVGAASPSPSPARTGVAVRPRAATPTPPPFPALQPEVWDP